MPEISVVIPTYESARYVGAAIESVLAQTHGDFEIIVVDDGSKDATAAVVAGYADPRVRYVRQENSGVAVARNRGMAEATGRWVAFLDADDTWYPEKLARQMAALRESGSRFCYSAYMEVDANLSPRGIKRSVRHAAALEDLLLRGNIVGSICTVVCDRELILATGGFDRRLSQCADWNMWVRLASSTDFTYIDEPLVTYRQHAASMSRNAPLMEFDSLLVLDSGFALPDLPANIRAKKREAYGRAYTVLAGTYFQAGQYASFVRCAFRALLLQGSQIRYFAQYPARVLKRMSAAG
jgi:glycosyltransferase involved in cell wall biosynthesis